MTPHPTAAWVQQLREAFPEPCRYRYVILDRDRMFDAEVMGFLKATGLEPKRSSVQAPWHNGIVERWIGSCRQELLDRIIALNEEHLRRVMYDYVKYHEQDRLHDALEKDAPNRRAVEQRSIHDAGSSKRKWALLTGTNTTKAAEPRIKQFRNLMTFLPLGSYSRK